MNFFGHAVVAQRIDDHPDFVLGAMAPDLLAMCGAVAVARTSPRVVAGEAHHLVIDRLFHGSQAFCALQAWAARALIERGLRRGGARGVAHVGVELFLDGLLAGQAPARAAYARSLADAETTRVPFVWRDEPSRLRWLGLVARLRAGAIPDAYRDPDFVAARLAGALAARPRLALTAAEVTIVQRFLPALKARVAADADALTGSLSSR